MLAVAARPGDRSGMPTKLDKALKREIVVREQSLVLTLTPEGVTITEKGHRKGKTFGWAELWSGDYAMHQQLKASLGAPALRADAASPSDATSD
jgi:hypothetical protein